MRCRATVRGVTPATRVAIVAGMLAALCAPLVAAQAGATNTPTTVPGPAPNQSQINSTQAQVSQIEGTLTQEEQQGSVLDDKYNTAEQDLQNAQNQLQSLAASLVHTKSEVSVDKKLRLVGRRGRLRLWDAGEQLHVLLLFVRLLEPSARHVHRPDRRQPDTRRNALQGSESRLQNEETQQQTTAAQAQTEATQAKSLAQANEQEAAATKSTLDQVQGQLANEVAAAAIQEAQEEAAAAVKAASQQQQQQAEAAAEAAAAVAGAVGGSGSGAAATDAANQASGDVGPVGGTGSGDAAQMAAVQAAVSQLGVPYVFGARSPGRASTVRASPSGPGGRPVSRSPGRPRRSGRRSPTSRSTH